MILLEPVGNRLQKSLAGSTPPCRAVARDWNELERMAPDAVCCVVLVEELGNGNDVARLSRFRRRYPCVPIVLVTRGSMENARRLCEVDVDEVVWTADVERDLPLAVERMVTRGTLRPVAALLGEARGLPRMLRTALVHACTTERPVYSVADLASSVHCDRTTLCGQWRKVVAPNAELRLVDFLALVLLLHAVRRRSLGQKLPEIADQLGVHHHTLRRLHQRLVGRPASRSPYEDQAAIAGVLGAVVDTLIQAAPPRGAE